MPNHDHKELSFLTTQMNALGLEQDYADHPEVKEERAVLGKLPIPEAPWETSGGATSRYSGRLRQIVAAAAIVVGFGFLYQYQQQSIIELQDQVRVKGQLSISKTTIFVERQGVMTVWDRSPLKEGDSFQVEVTDFEPLQAFLIPFDKTGTLLEDPAQILADKLVMPGNGQPQVFPQSYTLTGTSVGESIRVLSCPLGIEVSVAVILQRDPNRIPRGCTLIEAGMRP